MSNDFKTPTSDQIRPTLATGPTEGPTDVGWADVSQASPTPIRFMVTWLVAAMRSGSIAAKARSTVSAIRWVVSVLPAHTAAGGWASRKEPAGIRISTAARHPHWEAELHP